MIPAPVVEMVIAPEPFVIKIPLPAVKVDLTKELPVEEPINNCPSVYDVCPVPPYRNPIVDAFQVPDVNVPTEVSDDETTAEPKETASNTFVPLILYVYPVEALISPTTCNL